MLADTAALPKLSNVARIGRSPWVFERAEAGTRLGLLEAPLKERLLLAVLTRNGVVRVRVAGVQPPVLGAHCCRGTARPWQPSQVRLE